MPVNVTACEVERLLQKGDAEYTIVAVGKVLMVTVVVVVCTGQAPVAAIV